MDIVLTREETMETLRKCLNHVECPCMTEGCYLAGHHDCMVQLYENVVALLEEQKAVEPRVSSAEQRCGNCNKIIEMDGWKACPWCGKPINWESWW